VQYRETGLSRISFPFVPHSKCVQMNADKQIPYYAPDGRSLGSRSLEAAKRLIEGGYVKPSYGRKGHLKAIWLQQEDGASPVDTHAKAGTRYSFIENLEHGRCWKLRPMKLRDDDGVEIDVRPVFLAVLNGCVAR
jgi:hypothetical protein